MLLTGAATATGNVEFQPLIDLATSVLGTAWRSPYVVVGKHTYEKAGEYAIHVVIKSTLGATADVTSPARVAPVHPEPIVTNPPMGKRVPIANLPRLIADLFAAAATVLQPGGRLVFANPLPMESPNPTLKLHSRQVVVWLPLPCSNGVAQSPRTSMRHCRSRSCRGPAGRRRRRRWPARGTLMTTDDGRKQPPGAEGDYSAQV